MRRRGRGRKEERKEKVESWKEREGVLGVGTAAGLDGTEALPGFGVGPWAPPDTASWPAPPAPEIVLRERSAARSAPCGLGGLSSGTRLYLALVCSPAAHSGNSGRRHALGPIVASCDGNQQRCFVECFFSPCRRCEFSSWRDAAGSTD